MGSGNPIELLTTLQTVIRYAQGAEPIAIADNGAINARNQLGTDHLYSRENKMIMIRKNRTIHREKKLVSAYLLSDWLSSVGSPPSPPDGSSSSTSFALPFFPCAFRAPFFRPRPFFLPPFSFAPPRVPLAASGRPFLAAGGSGSDLRLRFAGGASFACATLVALLERVDLAGELEVASSTPARRLDARVTRRGGVVGGARVPSAAGDCLRIVSLSGEFSHIVSSVFEGEATFPSCSSRNVSSTGEFSRIVSSASGWVAVLLARLGDPERRAAAPRDGARPVGIMIEKDDRVCVASGGREPDGGAGEAGLDEPASAMGGSAGDSSGGALGWRLAASRS
jgi:hypothetical protein